MKQKTTKEEQRPMLFEILTLIISLLAIIISLVTLYVSEKGVWVQTAEYEYKIGPKFELTASVTLADVLVNGTEKKLPLLRAFHVDNIEENNLDELFLVDPRFNVQKIDRENISESVESYFSNSIKEHDIPDFSDTVNDVYYYYRFLVIKSLDKTTDVRVLYFKSRPMDVIEKTGDFRFSELDKVTMLEFEKGHLDDPLYAGERKIAEQYKEIADYLNQFE